MDDALKLMESLADRKLLKNPNDLAANRVKAEAFFARDQIRPALRYAEKGIPIGENGEMEIVRRGGNVDVRFAALMRDLYTKEGKWDEAIKWCELYANHFPLQKTAEHESFLKDLEELKVSKNSAEQNAEQLLKDEIDEKKKKKKKGKEKAGTCLTEAEEEKKSTELEDESSIVESETKTAVQTAVESETKTAVQTAVESEDNHKNWTSSVTYSIFMRKEHDVFVGSLVSEDNGVEEHSFIEASNLQLVNYKKLKELGSTSAGVLYVEKKICGPEGKTFLVVEPVNSVDSVFLNLMGSDKIGKAQWWRLIAEPFKRTFREIIEALLLIYSKGLVCGNLLFGLFMTPDGRAKVLPSMDPKKNAVEDLHQLISKMKFIIGLPFGTIDVVNDPEFDLPPSLKHFLVSYGQTTPNLVAWILRAPFFWSRDEEFSFLERVAQLIRNNPDVRKKLGRKFERHKLYQGGVWCTVLDGPYLAIWAKGDPNLPRGDPIPQGCVQIYPYKKGIDLYRYLCATIKHINEKEYDTLRTNEEHYDDDKKSSDIKGYFPEIYTNSHKMISEILRVSPELMVHFMTLFKNCGT